MNIDIKQQICWVCGKDKSSNTHHVIPQHLNPINNILVSVCNKCHQRINDLDKGAVIAYLHKILKLLEENRNAVCRIKTVVQNEIDKNVVDKEASKNG